jgi:sporulation protein YlmC with PRC-barrel domain
MSAPAAPGTIGLRALLGRPVYDANGTRLGRVYEILAEPAGGDLRVAALRVGPRALLARLGVGDGRGGRLVPWERVATLTPRITLRPGVGGDE